MEDKVNFYQSAGILCRKCLEIPVSERELAETLDRYLETLEDEIRVPPAIYESRLALCAECPHRVGYTCQKCGCYVQARAAKRAFSCPDTPRRWQTMQDDE